MSNHCVGAVYRFTSQDLGTERLNCMPITQSCIKYSTNKYQYQYQYQWSKYQYQYQYLTFKCHYQYQYQVQQDCYY